MREPCYVEAPEFFSISACPRPLVFLAGGITNCPDWQHEVCEHAIGWGFRGTILNPRRKEFQIGNRAEAKKQISWEYESLRVADVVAFWFCRDTLQPIVLYELGATAERTRLTGKPRIIVGAELSYERRLDVEVQLSLSTKSTDCVIDETLVNFSKKLAILSNTWDSPTDRIGLLFSP